MIPLVFARTGDGGENFTNHFWWQGKFYRLDDEDGSGTEQPADAAQPQQDEAEHPKIAAGETENATPELTSRRTGERGKQVIDKPTYNKLTSDFLRRGGIVIRGKKAAQHLDALKVDASYVTGGNFAYIRDDATVSEVLEEMYHAEQDRTHMFGEVIDERVYYMREIDAQKYLLSVAERYKIPIEEQNAVKEMLSFYQGELDKVEKGR